MLLRVGYEMAFSFPQPTAMVLMLHVHPSRGAMIRKSEQLEVEPWVPVSEYTDSFGNRCSRLVVPSGRVAFRNDAIVEDSGQPDPQVWDALPHNVQDLPHDVLQFLLASRYCAVDSEEERSRGGIIQRCAARLAAGAGHL